MISDSTYRLLYRLCQAQRLEDVLAIIDNEVAATPQPVTKATLEAERASVAEQAQKYILFSLAGAKYAMPLNQVLEISRAPKLMPLPHVPEWLLGVTNLRGDIISVIDLHSYLGLPQEARRDAGRMCVVRGEKKELVTGLMVDRVDGQASLTTETFGWPMAPLEGSMSNYLRGIGEHNGQLLRILNLDSLLLALDLSA